MIYSHITVSVYDWSILADEKIHITTLFNEAQELIFIVYPGLPAKKKVYIEPMRQLADKIVYLKTPEILKKLFCLRCGKTKLNSSWEFCARTFCNKTENKAMVVYLQQLIRALLTRTLKAKALTVL
jgi:hypothetical protein